MESKMIREEEVTEAQWLAIRAKWEKHLLSSLKAEDRWLAGDCSEEGEKFIQRQVKRLSYEPMLPYGAAEEKAQVKRLQRVKFRTKAEGLVEVLPRLKAYCGWLAELLQETIDCYYIRKPLPKEQKDEFQELRAKALKGNDTGLRQACDAVLLGVPEAVSDFYFEKLYVLLRIVGGKEQRQRMVRIHNKHGFVSEPVEITALAMSQPVRLRELLYNVCSGAAWIGGEKAEHAMGVDMSVVYTWHTVREVTVRMYDEEADAWFFEDVAYDWKGCSYVADENGIFRMEARNRATGKITEARFKLGKRDHEDQRFRHGLPQMKPHRRPMEIGQDWFQIGSPSEVASPKSKVQSPKLDWDEAWRAELTRLSKAGGGFGRIRPKAIRSPKSRRRCRCCGGRRRAGSMTRWAASPLSWPVPPRRIGNCARSRR